MPIVFEQMDPAGYSPLSSAPGAAQQTNANIGYSLQLAQILGRNQAQQQGNFTAASAQSAALNQRANQSQDEAQLQAYLQQQHLQAQAQAQQQAQQAHMQLMQAQWSHADEIQLQQAQQGRASILSDPSLSDGEKQQALAEYDPYISQAQNRRSLNEQKLFNQQMDMAKNQGMLASAMKNGDLGALTAAINNRIVPLKNPENGEPLIGANGQPAYGWVDEKGHIHGMGEVTGAGHGKAGMVDPVHQMLAEWQGGQLPSGTHAAGKDSWDQQWHETATRLETKDAITGEKKQASADDIMAEMKKMRQAKQQAQYEEQLERDKKLKQVLEAKYPDLNKMSADEKAAFQVANDRLGVRPPGFKQWWQGTYKGVANQKAVPAAISSAKATEQPREQSGEQPWEAPLKEKIASGTFGTFQGTDGKTYMRFRDGKVALVVPATEGEQFAHGVHRFMQPLEDLRNRINP